LLDEVHGNGVPRASRDGELFQEAVRPMSRYLSMSAGGAGTYIVLYKGADTRPGVFPVD